MKAPQKVQVISKCSTRILFILKIKLFPSTNKIVLNISKFPYHNLYLVFHLRTPYRFNLPRSTHNDGGVLRKYRHIKSRKWRLLFIHPSKTGPLITILGRPTLPSTHTQLTTSSLWPCVTSFTRQCFACSHFMQIDFCMHFLHPHAFHPKLHCGGWKYAPLGSGCQKVIFSRSRTSTASWLFFFCTEPCYTGFSGSGERLVGQRVGGRIVNYLWENIVESISKFIYLRLYPVVLAQ